jgi:hypothetical protein
MITDHHYQDLVALVEKCQLLDSRLTDWEYTFISDLAVKLDDHGEDIRISDKQQAVLERLRAKVDR